MALNAIQSRALRMKEIAGKAAQYLDASDKMKPLDAIKKKLSGDLKECAEKYGIADEKGTYTLEVPGFRVMKIASKSTAIDHEKAIAKLTELGLLERCTRTILDEKALEVCFQEGLIDIEAINSFSSEVEGSARVGVERA